MGIKKSHSYDGVDVINLGNGDAGIEGLGDDGVGSAFVTLFVAVEDIPELMNDLQRFLDHPEEFGK